MAVPAIFDRQPKDVGDILQRHEDRLNKLQQQVGAPGLPPTVFPDGITVGPDLDGIGTYTPLPPTGEAGTPTVLTITPGIFRGQAYVDIVWVAATAGPGIGFDVSLAKRLTTGPDTFALPNKYKTFGENIRIEGLVAGQVYGVQIRSFSVLGELSATAFPATYQQFTASTDSTVPAQVTGVSIGRGATTAVVQFTPNTDFDVALGLGTYKVQIDTVNTFSSGDFKEVIDSGTVVGVDQVTSAAGYYARVAAIDASGNQGPWSTTAGPVTVGGVIDAMVVTGLSAAKITVGTMSGDRITTNTLDAGTIKTSSITTASIELNGGALYANNPGTGSTQDGVIFDSGGIRCYQNGDITVDIDASTGDATFTNVTVTGVFETATSGQRIKIYGSSGSHFIEFWPPSGTANPTTPTLINEFNGNGSYPKMRTLQILGAAYPAQTHPPLFQMISDGTTSPIGARASIFLAGDHIDIDSSGFGTGDKSINLFGVNCNMTLSGSLFNDRFNTWGAINDAGTAVDFQHWNQRATDNGLQCTSSGEIHLQTSNYSSIHMYSLTMDISSGNTIMLDAGGTQIYLDSGGVAVTGWFRPDTIGSSATGPDLTTDGSGHLAYDVSSLRFKDNILTLEDDDETGNSDLLMSLRPVTYNSIIEGDNPETRFYGLIAEEVAKVDETFVFRNSEGQVTAICWNQLYPLMIRQIQLLRQEVDALKG